MVIKHLCKIGYLTGIRDEYQICSVGLYQKHCTRLVPRIRVFTESRTLLRSSFMMSTDFPVSKTVPSLQISPTPLRLCLYCSKVSREKKNMEIGYLSFNLNVNLKTLNGTSSTQHHHQLQARPIAIWK